MEYIPLDGNARNTQTLAPLARRHDIPSLIAQPIKICSKR